VSQCGKSKEGLTDATKAILCTVVRVTCVITASGLLISRSLAGLGFLRAGSRSVSIGLLLLAWVAVPTAFAGDAQQDGWSAELLERILKSEKPAPAASVPPGAPGEMVLRTYQLSHLRLGEAGKPQTLLTLLSKLLPTGSSMKPDIGANSLHILTTVAAHTAVWEFLSAIDVAEAPSASPGSVIPDDVKAALVKVAQTGDQSASVLSAIDRMGSGVSRELAEIDARQRRQTLRLVAGGAGVSILILCTVAWMLRRRPAPEPTLAPAEPAAALALVPDQLATALTPVHDKMRTEMLGLLNEVAIKLQAQHNEQQKQLEDARQALVDERRQFINDAGTMVVQAVERVDATTSRLAKQQDKVTELVQELQNTVRELDETKDNLRNREIELEQERAKIAALSLLLEEGGSVPPMSGTAANGATAVSGSFGAAVNDGRRTDISISNGGAFHPCMTTELPTRRTEPPTPPAALPPLQARPRFQFLPPDHPET
jgi:hypothetical protein